MQLSRRCYHRWIARMSGEAAATNNRLIAHETRVVGRRDTESRPYFAMPYRPRQQRANPFSLMNHETRQRHRNTLKRGDSPPPRAPSFVASYPPLLQPPILLSLNPLTYPSIFVLYHSSSPSRFASPRVPLPQPQPPMLLLYNTCACSGKRELS